MRVLIIANGEMPSAELARSLASEAELVVAADGGADRALAIGISPDLVVGDLDSLSAAAREHLGHGRLVETPDPERTDLEKAVEHALTLGAREITVIAAGGGRLDHALANLSVLVRFRGRAALTISDDRFDVRCVEGRATVDRAPGTVVSLVALGPCLGVTTSGLRWELDGEALEFSARGIHNEVVSRPATVSLTSGDLLLFEGRWIEKHG